MTAAIARTISWFSGVSAATPPSASADPAAALVRVEAHRDIEHIAQHVEEWERLVSCAADPNPFYEHWMLLPALAHLRGEARVIVAFIFTRSAPDAAEELVGVFPLEELSLPFGPRLVRLWKHEHCYLCTPLLREDATEICCNALLEFLRFTFGSHTMLELPLLPADGDVFDDVSQQFLRQRIPHSIRSVHTRALLEIGPSASAYLQSRRIKPHLKTWSRLRRRLGERGAVATRRIETDIDAAIERFIALEASGWKGNEGTALACRPDERAYFTQVCREAFRQQRLIIYELTLDGRAIASQINLVAGEGAFALKVAYDEQYARYSPGMLLEVEAIHCMHDERRIRWVDSCTAPGNRTMKRIWQQRRTLSHVICAPRKTLAGLALSVLPLARHVRQMVRDFTGRCSMLITSFFQHEAAVVAEMPMVL